jgi:predicted nucleic acid-binding protein
MQKPKAALLTNGRASPATPLSKLIAGCLVLPLDQLSATVAAYIFWLLSRSDRNKHWKDVFVAATALAHKYGIATRNITDFERIAGSLPPGHPRLYITNWKR